MDTQETTSNSLPSAGTIKGPATPVNWGLKNADKPFVCEGGDDASYDD